MNVQAVEIGCGVLAAIVVVFLFLRASKNELARRDRWFTEAKTAFPPGWSAWTPAEIGGDGFVSTGTFEGEAARFAADKTATAARLDVAIPAGVDHGALFDLIVRESRGSLETGHDDVSAGFDDEHSRIILKTPGGRSGAAAVTRLFSEAKSFRERLPAILAEAAKERVERGSRVFGEQTGEGGKHRHLGVGLSLSLEDWELTRDRPDLLEWERIPPESGEALPVELRLMGVAQDPALAQAPPRERLVARVLAGSAQQLADGSFEGAAPDIEGRSGPDVAGFKTALATVDFQREVVLGEDERMEKRPYRGIVHAVFVPWAVLVLELAAPRGEADALMEKILAGASFEAPARKD